MTFNKLYIKTICRVYRSYYKGYMDKTKGKGGGGFGWGGVEGWGENADNCNWITIKNLKKDLKKQFVNFDKLCVYFWSYNCSQDNEKIHHTKKFTVALLLIQAPVPLSPLLSSGNLRSTVCHYRFDF